MTQGLVQLNKDLGVEIQLNAQIDEIIIDPKYKQADGVRVNGLVQRFDKSPVYCRFSLCCREVNAVSLSS